MRAPAFLLVLAAVAAALLFAGARSAAGHGAVVRLAAGAVSAGDSLGVSGEGLGSADTVGLVLEGAAGSFPLGTVVGDERGRFTLTVLIPAAIPVGQYRVIATAGHDRASADLLVTADAPAMVEGHMEMVEASSEPVPLERRRAPMEIGLAGILFAALVAAGFFLFRSGDGRA